MRISLCSMFYITVWLSKTKSLLFPKFSLATARKTMQNFPAAERNKEPILKVLKELLPTSSQMQVLEIGSGSGQHVCHFAKHFANVVWQPTDNDEMLFQSIKSHIAFNQLDNVKQPLKVDASTPFSTWPKAADGTEKYDAILCVNVIHISPWKTTLGLFDAAQLILKPNGLLITYGPYAEDGVLQPESNVRFDAGLRKQDPDWGVRDISDLKKLATQNGLEFVRLFEMPANNKMLAFKKL